MKETDNYFVTEEAVGVRLDVYLSQTQSVTRSCAQNWITEGHVTVNGSTQTKNYKMRAGDAVALTLPDPVLLDLVPQPIPLDIVYEDAYLLVVNKPKGMVVHPAPGHPDGTLCNALMYHCGHNLSAINGILRPGIVHRIDRDTSGLLLVAKEDKAHLSLAEQIASHRLERCYQAVVHGTFSQSEGTVDKPIGRHPTKRKCMAITSDGKEARTDYQVLSSYRSFSHLQLRLHTGRTHQIRVHMASIGHPVVGDSVYGHVKHPFDVRNASLLQGQCLHAKTISFLHPHTHALMRFDSPLPDYFTSVLDKIKETAP